MAVFSTLKLDPGTWDLTVDAFGNIAADGTSYAVAQDVASSVRTFQGELFYDTTQGIPYHLAVLGQNFSQSLAQAYAEQAALTVPGVTAAQASVGVDPSRRLTGSVKVIDETGQSLNAHF